MKIRSIAACLLAFAVPALISGCGPSISTSQALPALNGPSNAAGARTVKQRVRFVIHLPKRKHHGRSPSYLSYATKSMRVSVALGGVSKFNKVVDLTVSSKGCASTAVNAQCAFDVALAAGNGYIASFTTYDQKSGKGKILSVAANTVFNVLAGQTTVVGITLDGVPTKLAVFQAGTNGFYAITLDPDNNVIVGPGAPQLKATGRGARVATIQQPTAAAPNTIRLTQIPGAGGSELIDVTAGYPLGATDGCAVTGAVCTFAGVATAHAGQEVFLANDYDVAPSSVVGFRVPLSAGQKPDNKITINYPFTLGLDSSSNLFVPQYSSSGSLNEYAPPYTAVKTSSPGIGYAEGTAVAADGNIFIVGDSIYELAPPYGSAPTAFTAPSQAEGIGVDASDNIYVSAKTTLYMFSPPYTSGSTVKHTVTLASTAAYPVLVSGNMVYVGEQSDIEGFTLPITTNNPPAAVRITQSVDYAYGLTMDPKGNLYVANYYGGNAGLGSVLIYNAPLTTGENPSVTLSAAGYSQDVVLDNAGNVYVSSYEGGAYGLGALYEFNPPFTNSSQPAVVLALTSGINIPYGDGLVITPPGPFSVTLNQ